MVNVAFTIAGSEATGGAGAQTDLKTFHKLGTFGAAALTCIVSFNPRDNWNHQFVPIDSDVISQQIDAIVAVHNPDTVKIAMLGTVPTIDAVAEKLAEHEWKNVVVDPVLICKGQEPGAALDTDNALKEKIIPFATVVTPNVFETEQLSGLKVTDLDSLKAAAQKIHDDLGVPYVVAKGGAVLPGPDAVDVLYDGEDFAEFRTPKIGERYVSGAGCTLAAAITAELAKGASVRDAVQTAKNTVTDAIRNRIDDLPTPFDEVYQAI